jgi:CDP-glycerol glycerophosphotransferase (TagB/SpsB family)
VVKLKPGADSKAYYQALLREGGSKGMVLTDEDLYPLLVAADVVVTPPSSIAIEALIVGKPVVYVVFADAEDYFPHLGQLQAVLQVRDASHLTGAIGRALSMEGASFLSPEKMQALLEEENHQPDGKASQGVMEVVEGLINGSGATQVRTLVAAANT